MIWSAVYPGCDAAAVPVQRTGLLLLCWLWQAFPSMAVFLAVAVVNFFWALRSPGPDFVMVAVVFLWGALMVLVLMHGVVCRWFNRLVFYFDRFTGLILGAIGVKIVHGAVSHS